MPKLTFDEAFERLNEERTVKATDVQTKALGRKLWGYGGGQPGCLYDNGPNLATTKKSAIESILWTVDEEAPRGFATELRRNHSANACGMRWEIYQTTLREMLD